MNEVKFKQKVVPGDTLIFRLDLLEPVRRGLCHMLGRTYVNGKLVAEADMLAQLVKVRNVVSEKKETHLS
jgi:UDP-3-O-[3-hydroxymyristoyl] N-acetylglucosamine deacetylase/3-hydroxyacyl-[acyl-carrier-protein] dehydratase